MSEPTAEQSHLNNLLAVIHRDGGQHQDEVGTEQAVADAMEAVVKMRERITELEAELHAAETVHDNERENFRITLKEFKAFDGDGDLWAALISERDELKEENERLKSELSVLQADYNPFIGGCE